MEEKYELTVKVLGPDDGQAREVRVINRILRWTTGGVGYEADPRHVEIMPGQLDIKKCKPVATPGAKNEGHAKPGDQANRHVEESHWVMKDAVHPEHPSLVQIIRRQADQTSHSQ